MNFIIMKNTLRLFSNLMITRASQFSELSFTSIHYSSKVTNNLLFERSSLQILQLYSKMSNGTTTRISAYEGLKRVQNDIKADMVVDLRSDTVTKPGKAMRQAMAEAIVGDDVLREDFTVQELEARMAKIFGKEAGLFVTSGTMGNLLAGLAHCETRSSEIIIGDQSHMFVYEQANLSQFGGVHSNQIPNNPDGTFDIRGVIDRIRSDDIHYAITKLICVENTHNRCGGRVMPLEWLDKLSAVAKSHKIPLHMDGARVFNASIALGQPVSRITRDFNSVSICISKGLGGPIGAVLVGEKKFIEKARRLRKALGGAMRQVGILAQAGLYCLDNMIDRLKDDHENAKVMAKIINGMNSPHVFVKSEDLETNIMMLYVNEFPIDEFCQRLGMVNDKETKTIGSSVSILCGPWSENMIRLVTHCDVSDEMAVKAAEKICLVTKEFTQTLSK